MLKDIYDDDHGGDDDWTNRKKKVFYHPSNAHLYLINPMQLAMPDLYKFLKYFESHHPIDEVTVDMPKLLRLFSLQPAKQGFGCNYVKMDNSAFLSFLKRNCVQNLPTASQWTDKVRNQWFIWKTDV